MPPKIDSRLKRIDTKFDVVEGHAYRCVTEESWTYLFRRRDGSSRTPALLNP